MFSGEMDFLIGQSRKLREEAPDILPVRIIALPLKDRVKNAEIRRRIDPASGHPLP